MTGLEPFKGFRPAMEDRIVLDIPGPRSGSLARARWRSNTASVALCGLLRGSLAGCQALPHTPSRSGLATRASPSDQIPAPNRARASGTAATSPGCV